MKEGYAKLVVLDEPPESEYDSSFYPAGPGIYIWRDPESSLGSRWWRIAWVEQGDVVTVELLTSREEMPVDGILMRDKPEEAPKQEQPRTPISGPDFIPRFSLVEVERLLRAAAGDHNGRSTF